MIRNVSLIILFDENNKILFQHRADDAPVYPGYFGFFGGGMEEGETPEDAVRRETFEELDYVLKNPKLILTLDYKTETCEGRKFYFIEKCIDKHLLNLQEGQNMKWVTFAQTKNLKINDWNKKILEQLEKILL